MSIPFVSCASDYHPIPVGSYCFGIECLLVAQSKISFHIKLDKQIDEMITREYKYTVLSDGRIQPFPLRSVDAVLGVGKFDWYWDGQNINRTNPKTNETDLFLENKKGTR
jgi:hypothetical protein